MVFLDSILCVEAGYVPEDLVPMAEVEPSSLKSYSKLLSGITCHYAEYWHLFVHAFATLLARQWGQKVDRINQLATTVLLLSMSKIFCLDGWREGEVKTCQLTNQPAACLNLKEMDLVCMSRV